ncbi:hypothetical protein [Streptomyces sp. Caat 7-52]|uniref:hypothetical protein n=1 Tax=Streptomyces sp. Caat 7-52 TaxID=2949637 RepID=UPI002034F806|nr:hypothetical protein [Streptomyces sp. Caat 7-52]
MTSLWPPPWSHCDVTTPDPCSGTPIGAHTKCLAHLVPADRAAYLAGLAPGADINVRGSRITAPPSCANFLLRFALPGAPV